MFKMTKDLTIRNSTAEFLIFQSNAREDSIEVKFIDGTIWLSQKMIAKLFDVDRTVVTKHLKNIFESGELVKDSVSAIIAHTAKRADENSDCRKYRHTALKPKQ